MATTSAGGWVRVLFRATLIGTILQLLMVIAGHYDASVKSLFALLGMSISLAAGFIFGRWSGSPGRVLAVVGGAVAGGVCALIGVMESYSLEDVSAAVLWFGPAGSAATGALGGLLGRLARRQG
jgi:hypothetical protein